MSSLVELKLVSFGRGSLEISGQRNYQKKFLVETDDPLLGDNWVRALSGISKIGEKYITPLESDLGAWCNKVTVERDEKAPWFWEVVCEFTSGTGDPVKDEPNPLLRPAEFSYETERQNVPAVADVRPATDGEAIPITNTAGEPFDPNPEMDWSNGVIKVRKNWAAVDIDFLDSFVDCVNSVPLFGFAAGTVKFDSYRIPESKWENSVFFWQVEYTFKRRRQPPWLNNAQILSPLGDTYTVISPSSLGGPWRIRPLNQGKKEIDPETDELVAILDPRTSKTVTGDTLLDENGYRIEWPLTPTNQPFFIEYQIYEEKDLNELGLP